MLGDLHEHMKRTPAADCSFSLVYRQSTEVRGAKPASSKTPAVNTAVTADGAAHLAACAGGAAQPQPPLKRRRKGTPAESPFWTPVPLLSDLGPRLPPGAAASADLAASPAVQAAIDALPAASGSIANEPMPPAAGSMPPPPPRPTPAAAAGNTTVPPAAQQLPLPLPPQPLASYAERVLAASRVRKHAAGGLLAPELGALYEGFQVWKGCCFVPANLSAMHLIGLPCHHETPAAA